MSELIFVVLLGWMCCGPSRKETMERQKREEEMAAIREHAQATGEPVEKILQAIARHEMLVVPGSRGLMVVFNSPNGL